MDRHKLVLGKFFTIAVAGIITALITVSSMALWGLVLSQGMAVEFVVKIMSMIGLVDFFLIFLMLVPVVAVLQRCYCRFLFMRVHLKKHKATWAHSSW
jgi:sodium transport system permease protein